MTNKGSFSEETVLTNLVSRVRITPMNYGIFYAGNQLRLLKPQEVVDDESTITKVDPPDTWRAFIDIYGTLITGQSEIRIELPTGNELIGSITYHPSDPNILLFTAVEDTMPLNTLEAIDAIINPINVEVDNALLSPTSGTRYLLTDDIGNDENQFYSIWGAVVARENDIIEYTGSEMDQSV
jgi:hypothetical protein